MKKIINVKIKEPNIDINNDSHINDIESEERLDFYIAKHMKEIIKDIQALPDVGDVNITDIDPSVYFKYTMVGEHIVDLINLVDIRNNICAGKYDDYDESDFDFSDKVNDEAYDAYLDFKQKEDKSNHDTIILINSAGIDPSIFEFY